jgi:hypothetical protein
MASPPPNDDFDQATVVSALPFTNELDTTDATPALDDPTDCFGLGGSSSVWYVFTPSHDLKVQADTYGSDYDTLLAVYTGVRGSLSFVPPCSPSGGLIYDRLVLSLSEGVTYYFEVFAGSGHLRFNVRDYSQAAVNDDITNAVPIETLPFTDGSNTAAATRDPQDPVCADHQGGTVWYSFTPDTDVRVYATSQHSHYSNSLAVYSSPTASPLVLNEVDCLGNFPQVSFDAKAGKTYFLMVSALDPAGGGGSPLDEGGFLNLLVQEAFRITEFTVDPKATVYEDSGTVTITGTVACNHPLGFVEFISGSVAQRGVEGSLEAGGLPCPRGESRVPWSATVASLTTKRFVPGIAQVTVQATGFFGGGSFYNVDQVTRHVAVTLEPPSQ